MRNNDITELEHTLDSLPTPPLSASERERVWNGVERRLVARTAVVSPYQYFSFKKTTMIPIAIALMVLLGAGGTVAASDNARPGDVLFPVDRAVEEMRLSLSTDVDRARLQLQFAEERLSEFEEIVREETSADDTASNTPAVAGGVLTEAEADIFTNETIVKIEVSDRQQVFATDADTRVEIVNEIADRYSFATATVDAVLVVEHEDRASRADDKMIRGSLSGDGRVRIEHALGLVEGFLIDTRSSAGHSEDILRALDERFSSAADGLPSDLRMRVKNDGDRIEFRNEDGERVRVEMKDGEIRVKTEDSRNSSSQSSSGSDDSRSGDSSSDDDNTSHLRGLTEAEADIFTDITTVTVELNDRKITFTTDADTRAEIIREIATRTQVTSAEVDAILSIEVENRASRPQDVDEDNRGGSDDDGDDSSDDDSDDQSEIRVKVEGGVAEVKVKIDGDEDEFELLLTNRTLIVAAIATRYGLTTSEVESVMEFEVD